MPSLASASPRSSKLPTVSEITSPLRSPIASPFGTGFSKSFVWPANENFDCYTLAGKQKFYEYGDDKENAHEYQEQCVDVGSTLLGNVTEQDNGYTEESQSLLTFDSMPVNLFRNVWEQQTQHEKVKILEEPKFEPGANAINNYDLVRSTEALLAQFEAAHEQKTFLQTESIKTDESDIGSENFSSLAEPVPVISSGERSKQVCSNSNCQASETTTWRYFPSDIHRIQPFCSACKLYYDFHRRHRPRSLAKAPKKNMRLKKIPLADRICTNCSTLVTPVWRFVGDNLYCNRCGQYRRKHGIDRPLE